MVERRAMRSSLQWLCRGHEASGNITSQGTSIMTNVASWLQASSNEFNAYMGSCNP